MEHVGGISVPNGPLGKCLTQDSGGLLSLEMRLTIANPVIGAKGLGI